MALVGWGTLFAQEQWAQPYVWQLSLPAGPYALGHNPENGSTAPDEPIPGFVGPAGDGVAPYNGQNSQQQVNPAFVEWASSVFDYSPAKPAVIDPAYLNPNVALGPVTGNVFDVASLGDLSSTDIAKGTSPGSLTLAFAKPIADGAGADFVVFGNAFNLAVRGKEMTFSKLAYVEVSSDGVNFARFPSVDTNPKPKKGPWSFMVSDPTLIYNLFGKGLNSYGVSWGVPFDLAQLSQHPLVRAGLLNLQNVRYVRFVAVVGNGSSSYDFLGNPIYDPWPTTGSPGPEVQAVGVLNIAPDPNAGATNGKPLLLTQSAPYSPTESTKSNSLQPQSGSPTHNVFSGSGYTALGNVEFDLAAEDLSPLMIAVAQAADEAKDDVSDSVPSDSSPEINDATTQNNQLSSSVATNGVNRVLAKASIASKAKAGKSGDSDTVTRLTMSGSSHAEGWVGGAIPNSSVVASARGFGSGFFNLIALAVGAVLAGWILAICLHKTKGS